MAAVKMTFVKISCIPLISKRKPQDAIESTMLVFFHYA